MDKSVDPRDLGAMGVRRASVQRGRAVLLALACLGIGWLPAACGGSTGLPSDAGTGGTTGGTGGTTGGSGGSTGATCGPVAACGGAVVGVWTVTDTCVTSDMVIGNTCSGITASFNLTFTGGVTYNTDLTYTQTGTQGGTARYHFPTACLGTMTCTQFQATLLTAGVAVGMGMTFQSATCSAEAGGCVCDTVITSTSAAETGTYVTTGGTISTTHQGTTDNSLYCVNGTTMHQMPPAGQGVEGAIVLSKQ